MRNLWWRQLDLEEQSQMKILPALGLMQLRPALLERHQMKSLPWLVHRLYYQRKSQT